MRLLRSRDFNAFRQSHSQGTNYVLAIGGWQFAFCPQGGFPLGKNPFVWGCGLWWFLVLCLGREISVSLRATS